MLCLTLFRPDVAACKQGRLNRLADCRPRVQRQLESLGWIKVCGSGIEKNGSLL
jgi:hypothetical protein